MEPDAAAVLVRARKAAGLSQAQVAARAGTAQPVISAYERGRRDPGIATLARLVAAAGGRLRLEVDPVPVGAPPPPADLADHGRRLVSVLSLADAVPRRRPRSTRLDAPRLVSR